MNGGERRAFLTAVVAVAVAFAFADSSIVVLALPEVYGRLHTSIEGVAWVITAYNAAVALAALLLVAFVRRWRAATLLTVGLLVFAAASVACSLATTLAFLVAARCVQGLGAALLLTGALPVLARLAGSAARGATVWTLAGTFGAVLGPALGGALTQAFDWRAIFAVQAPVALLALTATRAARVEAAGDDAPRRSLAHTVRANICLGLLFGALVGALFLSVLLVVTVWGYSPIAGAGIVSVLPAALLAARPLARRLPYGTAVCGGAALLAAGLVALALLPSADLAYALPALALCGAGVGLAVPVLSGAALDLEAGLTRTGALTVGVRHLGLVLALATIAPLLASALPDAGNRAKLEATAVLLDAPVGLGTKVPVALDLAGEFERARAGEIPNLTRPFDAHGARGDPKLATVRDRLVGEIEGTLTRAFRSSLLLSAALAALALLFALLSARGRAVIVSRGPAAVALAALLVASVALAAVELARGATRDDGTVANPCKHRPPFPGSGLDGTVQRIVLDGLDRAACRVGTTREELVLSLRRHPGARAAAVRAGLLKAVDAAGRRGDVPALFVPLVRRLVQTAPIERLIEGGISLSDLLG